MKPFRDLSLGNKLHVVALYTRMNMRALFGWKSLVFLAAVGVYYPAFCYVVVWTEARLTLGQALGCLVWMPSTLFAVFFAMEMVSRERDAGLLETFFTVSVSAYRIWITKFLTLALCTTLLAFALVVVSWWFVVDISIPLTLIAVLPPLYFFASLAVLLSAMLKSGNAAGIVMLALLAFVAVASDGLGSTVVYPFLNPFDRPYDTDPYVWARTVVYNKLAFVLLSGVVFWRSLRWLDKRERMLK